MKIEDWACADSIYNYIDDFDYADKIVGNISDVENYILAFLPHEIESSSMRYDGQTSEFNRSPSENMSFTSKSIEHDFLNPDNSFKSSNSGPQSKSPSRSSQIEIYPTSLEEKYKSSVEQNSQDLFHPQHGVELENRKGSL
jgi:hypothetical protein